MKIVKYKKISILFLVFAFLFTNLLFAKDDEGKSKKQLAIELELLEKMGERFDEITLSKDSKNNDKSFQVFNDINGLQITRKLHELGIYLYSVESNQVKIMHILEQLAISNSVKISFDERIEKVIKHKRIDVSLKELPFQDVLEIITGSCGLDFLLDKYSKLQITIPSNMGFKDPQEYFQSKIVKTFRKLQIKYPHSEHIPESHYKLGEFFYSKGLKIIASQEYLIVAQKFPKHPLAKDSLKKVAQCYMDIKDYKRAREIYNEFIERYPLDESLENVYWAITNTWFSEKKYDISIILYKKILDMYPSTELSQKINERIAFSYMEIGEFQKAFNLLIAMKKKIDQSDWSVEKDILIGQCLYEMDKMGEAFIVFASIEDEKELSRDQLIDTKFKQAECLYKMNHYIEAIEAYKRWMQISNNKVYGMFAIGKCLRHLELFNKAIGILKNATAYGEESEYKEQITFELALCYYKNSEYDKAISLFTDISKDENYEQFVDSNFYRAESLFGKKSYRKAIPVYKKIVPLLEKDIERLNYVEKRLSLCYQNLGLYDKALDTLRKEKTAKN